MTSDYVKYCRGILKMAQKCQKKPFFTQKSECPHTCKMRKTPKNGIFWPFLRIPHGKVKNPWPQKWSIFNRFPELFSFPPKCENLDFSFFRDFLRLSIENHSILLWTKHSHLKRMWQSISTHFFVVVPTCTKTKKRAPISILTITNQCVYINRSRKTRWASYNINDRNYENVIQHNWHLSFINTIAYSQLYELRISTSGHVIFVNWNWLSND